MLTIACIGNISRDYILASGQHAYTSLGGNALFTALPSVALGAATTIFGNMGHGDIGLSMTKGISDFNISNFEPIFPNSLAELNIFSRKYNRLLYLDKIRNIDGAGNIAFIKPKTEYSSFSETYIYSLAPILDEYFALKYMQFFVQCDAILFCPVNGEVSVRLIKLIRKYCKKSFLSIDMQGTVRQVGTDRKEYYTAITEIQDYIANVDFIKLNDIEAQYAFGIKNPVPATKLNWYTVLGKSIGKILHYANNYNPNLIFMITLGSEGLILGMSSRQIILINALPSNVIDHLGAGDAAHAAFVKSLLASKNINANYLVETDQIVRAGIAASIAGSLVVRGKGALGRLSVENFDQEMGAMNLSNQVMFFDFPSY